MGQVAGSILNIAKWPVALAVAVATPATALGLWEILVVAWNDTMLLTPYFLATLVTVLLWVFLRRIKTIQFWCTIEHELTHALFAYATFIPVRELNVTHRQVLPVGDGKALVVETDQASGHVRLEGGNWLVGLAPYFFPTAAFAVIVATWALADQPSMLARILLGVATGFSLVSTLAELHPGQTDLQREGFLYCFLILPGLNLWMYGSLFAYELGGWDLVLQLARGINSVTIGWIGLTL